MVHRYRHSFHIRTFILSKSNCVESLLPHEMVLIFSPLPVRHIDFSHEVHYSACENSCIVSPVALEDLS